MHTVVAQPLHGRAWAHVALGVRPRDGVALPAVGIWCSERAHGATEITVARNVSTALEVLALGMVSAVVPTDQRDAAQTSLAQALGTEALAQSRHMQTDDLSETPHGLPRAPTGLCLGQTGR